MLESKRFARSVLAAVAGAALVTLAAPREARADNVSPDGKGIAGGALIGGELVIFTEAIIGVRSPLAYGLGAGAGAVAGGFGGYAVETAVSDGRIPAYILAGGLALLIPAVVVLLDQTRYLPAEGARDDRPVQTLPPSDPGKPGGSAVIGAEPAPPPASSTPTPAPGAATPAPPSGGPGGGTTKAPERAPLSASLFDLDMTKRADAHQLRLGVPVPQVRPVFTAQQKKALGVDDKGTEVRFPVVSVTF